MLIIQGRHGADDHDEYPCITLEGVYYSLLCSRHFREIWLRREVMADILAKLFVLFVPGVDRALASGVQSLTYRLVKLRVGRKVSRATGQQFPLGYFLVARKVDA